MKKEIKIVKLPKEVLKRAKTIGNIFDILNSQKEDFEVIVCRLMVVLKDKYNLTDKQWNKDIAPILRQFYTKLTK